MVQLPVYIGTSDTQTCADLVKKYGIGKEDNHKVLKRLEDECSIRNERLTKGMVMAPFELKEHSNLIIMWDLIIEIKRDIRTQRIITSAMIVGLVSFLATVIVTINWLL